MYEFYINEIPKCILEKLFKLKEVTMFILPKGYIISEKFLNNWRDLINKKLYKIFERHKSYINIDITTFNLSTKIICNNNITIQTDDLQDLLINYLQQNFAISLIINNFEETYGYLIIPGYQIKCEKLNLYIKPP